MLGETTFVGRLVDILEECADYMREHEHKFYMEETSVLVFPVDEAGRWELRLYTVERQDA